MSISPVQIDTVIAGHQDGALEYDQLLMEWFEVNKQRLTRSTLSGKNILMQLKPGTSWHHGDALYAEGELQAVVTIKPVLTIRFDPSDLAQLADFTYFVGNRHLPLFQAEQAQSLRLPYDGRLYEQLMAKYGAATHLEEAVLLADNLIRQQIKNSRKNEN